MDAYRQLDCRHGRFTCYTQDQYVGRSLAVYGEWSEGEVDLFNQIVRSGDTVLEAGANIGSHTVALSRAVGTGGRVLAFEAARLTHQLLCANLVANECLNVHTHFCALGRQESEVEFPFLDPHLENNFGGAGLRMCTPDLAAIPGLTESVPMRRVDGLSLDRLDFLKLDVEGHELDVLEGARRTLEQLRPVVYAEIDLTDPRPAGNRDDLVRFLDAAGYDAYYHFTPMFSPNNYRACPDDIFDSGLSFDLVGVPRGRARLVGLTRASVGDNAFYKGGNGMIYISALPIDDARFSWGGEPVPHFQPSTEPQDHERNR